MKPLLTYKYDAKLSEDIKDIGDTMNKFLPSGDYILKSESEWLDEIDKEDFDLPNDKIIKTFTNNKGKQCNIYKFNLSTDNIGKKLLLRSQILTLLYIEAGSFIEISDDGRWEMYVIYEKNEDENKEIFVGFCTVYKYWNFASTKNEDAEDKFRGRISQVVILPPFQGMGYGKKLYEEIIEDWIKDDRCVEITVEDPSEEFDELRDRCDLERTLKDGLQKELKKLPLIESDDEIKTLRAKTKMTKRQFDRILEMCCLWMLEMKDGGWIEGLNDKTLRLMIKRRIYLQNREGLDGLGDPSLTKSKLQDVYERVVEGYREGAVGGVGRILKRTRDEE
jgi:histone acetyltransferase 1